MPKKGHGHHGGAWKVAYADFVTAMMALFLVLWLTAQDTKIKESVERAFRNPFSAVTKESTGLIPNKETTSSNKQQGNFQSVSALEMETMRHVSEDLARLLQKQDEEQNSIKIEITPEGLRVNVFDRTQKPVFETESDRFTPYGNWVFSTLAWEISRYRSFRVELEGHTQTVSANLAGPRGKWELSADRANAARRKLIQSGVGESQICKVSGYADTVPMTGYQKESEMNQRVTVLLKLKETMDAHTAAAIPASAHDATAN